MEFVQPNEYTNSKVDKAGQILVKRRGCSDKEEKEAIDIFNNWRESHAYPMHIIMKTLKKISKDINSQAVSVQRLKREKSLIGKLERFSTMQLSQVQDIGGCRVVMPDVSSARKLETEYKKRNKRHKRVKSREANYINNPKADGYRSIHLVYKYYSINKVGKVFNGRMIEIQIRSKLQHIWATALETVDLFTSQTIKLGGGKEKWRYFFKLLSSAFAMIEECPVVPDTPLNKKDLYTEIKRMATELNIFDRMSAWRSTILNIKERKDALFLLKLDMGKKQIMISSYPNNSKGRGQASKDLASEEEKNHDNKNFDVVLVAAENITDLKHAYRNYFADTQEFIKNLKQIIDTY